MSAWAGLLSGVHALIALRRNEQHWLLSEADAKTYGAAVANAARHLPIGATQKALDFAALAICTINIETPRVYASVRNSRARRAARDGQSPQGGGATVFQFRPPPPNSPPPPAPSAPGPVPPDGAGADGFQQDGIDGPIGGHV